MLNVGWRPKATNREPQRLRDDWRWLEEEIADLRSHGLFRGKRTVVPLAEGWCFVDGKRLRNFASNDYLNLAHDPRLIEAANAVLATEGIGSRASALVSGRSDWLARLEERLARFEEQDGAIVFPSGYAANVGTVCALISSQDTVFCDRLNHASLIDGCRLSGARMRVFRHQELARLERELKKASVGRRWIVTDSVFSMDGDLAPLPDLCSLAERFEAKLIVDEAHATGVFGVHGRGVAELYGVEDRISVRIGTLSKAIGCLGGFVTGPQPLIDWLWNRARTQMFSTALPPCVCAAACKAIDAISEEPERRRNLLDLSRTFRMALDATAFKTVPTAQGPIVPIILEHPERAVRIAKQLETEGFLVAAIRPPTVPTGTSRLRVTLTAAHSEQDLGNFVEALRACED